LTQAKNISVTRAAVGKDLKDHLELHARQFEDFSSLLEQTAIDGGEDSLCAGGPHTTNLNIAHIIHDKGDDVLRQTIELLQTDPPFPVKPRSTRSRLRLLR
jgi:hypothetical protein